MPRKNGSRLGCAFLAGTVLVLSQLLLATPAAAGPVIKNPSFELGRPVISTPPGWSRSVNGDLRSYGYETQYWATDGVSSLYIYTYNNSTFSAGAYLQTPTASPKPRSGA